jgi:hypothetical protein
VRRESTKTRAIETKQNQEAKFKWRRKQTRKPSKNEKKEIELAMGCSL